MDIHGAKLLTEQWLRKYDLQDKYNVRISSRLKKLLGYCQFPTSLHKGIITLGEEFVQLNTGNRVEQTIKHEIAHAITGRGFASHGIEWKRNAIILGVPPVACAGNVISPPYKFYMNCSGCKKLYRRNKLPQANMGICCSRCKTPVMSWQWKEFEKKENLDFLDD